LDKEAIVVMLETKKSTLLDDTTIENLWNILLEGM
jgi:hypothetical protein